MTNRTDLASIAGIVPAAGASRRMGRDKRRVLFEGRAVLEVTVAGLRHAGLQPIVVILEPGSPCRDLPGLAGVEIVVNPEPARGMLSSIRCGLSALPAAADAAAVLPGDHPFVPPAAISALISAFQERRPLLLAPRFSGRQGHPLFLSRALFDEAAACDDSTGLRQLVRRRRDDLLLLDLDFPGADQDLDVPADLARLKPRAG